MRIGSRQFLTVISCSLVLASILCPVGAKACQDLTRPVPFPIGELELHRHVYVVRVDNVTDNRPLERWNSPFPFKGKPFTFEGKTDNEPFTFEGKTDNGKTDNGPLERWWGAPFTFAGEIVRAFEGPRKPGEVIIGATTSNEVDRIESARGGCPIFLEAGKTYLLMLNGDEPPYALQRYGSLYISSDKPEFQGYITDLAKWSR